MIGSERAIDRPWPARAWIALTSLAIPPRRLASDDDGTVRESPGRLAFRSFLVVVGFWWSATGLIFALERTPATSGLGFLSATVLAVAGLWLLLGTRDARTSAAVRWSFLGGAFLWSWVQVAFYGGWLVGPPSLAVAMPAESPSWGHAVRAVLSMFWYQLGQLGVLLAAWLITRRRVNRMGWWGLLLFWCTHQVACINIYLGVENPGRGFFPEQLVFLESYFGPARNSWFLVASMALLLMLTLRFALHAIRDATPVARQAMMLLTVLSALGFVELAVIGTPLSLPLWDWFLALRGY
jgi:putative photosynthetic complex assembly protein 2